MDDSINQALSRKDFLELLTGIVAGLGISSGLPQLVHAKDADQAGDVTLDESYLVKGLTGMARAKTWFDAHWGAGVLAGYYLCRENSLGSKTTAAIKKQLDTVIRLRAPQFVSLPDERIDEALIDEVPKALRPAIEGGLRAHGHAVIFASLATKALRDAPQMAQPTLIENLCGLSRQIAKNKPQASRDPTFVYAESQEMIEATFDSLMRFKELIGHPSVRRPNFTHMVTHAEALFNLESMGYRDLAKFGHAGQQTHIGAPVPTFDDLGPEDKQTEVQPPSTLANPSTFADPSTLTKVMDAEFWSDKTNQERWSRKSNITDNPNGDWIAAGHIFKVLYSFHRLIARVADQEKVKVCSEILLERYVNPDVQGG